MLTVSLVRSVKRASTLQKLSDGGGLHRLVAPNGERYRRYDHRFNGKQKTLALGVYPDVGLATARVRHQAARRSLIDGVDIWSLDPAMSQWLRSIRVGNAQ